MSFGGTIWDRATVTAKRIMTVIIIEMIDKRIKSSPFKMILTVF
jgi:hypothetical protein